MQLISPSSSTGSLHPALRNSDTRATIPGLWSPSLCFVPVPGSSSLCLWRSPNAGLVWAFGQDGLAVGQVYGYDLAIEPLKLEWLARAAYRNSFAQTPWPRRPFWSSFVVDSHHPASCPCGGELPHTKSLVSGELAAPADRLRGGMPPCVPCFGGEGRRGSRSIELGGLVMVGDLCSFQAEGLFSWLIVGVRRARSVAPSTCSSVHVDDIKWLVIGASARTSRPVGIDRRSKLRSTVRKETRTIGLWTDI
ncbi:hypothetical protein B0T10DRAFT_41313 [Thelonectria olida]|uniref:Uncharacterized protein n=1 Tax=Thelonectria olida TaxID=1576542 RepID=A0A9P8W481_9HYPO|nr:hypothetical protein B0T10DRAFT_41313 [Thelonectria olida]